MKKILALALTVVITLTVMLFLMAQSKSLGIALLKLSEKQLTGTVVFGVLVFTIFVGIGVLQRHQLQKTAANETKKD